MQPSLRVYGLVGAAQRAIHARLCLEPFLHGFDS